MISFAALIRVNTILSGITMVLSKFFEKNRGLTLLDKSRVSNFLNFNCQFLTKTMDQPVWDKPNFLTVLTCCFYGLERRFFFFLEYRETQV